MWIEALKMMTDIHFACVRAGICFVDRFNVSSYMHINPFSNECFPIKEIKRVLTSH